MSHFPKEKSKAKVVVIGGGTGSFTLLSGLKNYFENISAIVTMADDGGSSGVLREEFGILPPGDVRRALVALSATDNKTLSDLFGYRFSEGRLRDQSFGNLMLTALERLTGSFDAAVEEAGKILSVKGRVIPVTLENVRLAVQLEDGSVVRGEHNIDVPKHDGNLKITKAWLAPPATVNPKARRVIREADFIVIAPGDLYTSIVPNLLVRGIPEALSKTRARVVWFVNLTTKFGETNGFRASDFLKVLSFYMHREPDYVILNRGTPSATLLRRYAAENSEWVKDDLGRPSPGAKILRADLVRAKSFIRHDPEKAARLLSKLAG